MYRLFLKIFFWYWLTAWAMIAIVLLGSRLTGMRQVSVPNMYATVAPILAAEAVKAYESGGPEAFARFSRGTTHNHERQLFLLDGFNKDVLSRPLQEDGLRAAQAAKDGQLVVLRGHIAAYKFVSSSGHPYTLVLLLKSDLREITDVLLGEGSPLQHLPDPSGHPTLLWACVSYCLSDPQYSVDGKKSRTGRPQSTSAGFGIQAL